MNDVVLGVDPGTAVTGYGLIAPGRRGTAELIECGVIRTDRKGSTGSRLRELHHGLGNVISTHKPGVLAIESVFLGKNARSTIALAQGRGIALLAAAEHDMDIYEFTPATVKKVIAGTGRARKEQIGYMVQRLLRLKDPPKPADAADGVALALTFLMTGGGR